MVAPIRSYSIENDAAFKKAIGDAARKVGDLRFAMVRDRDWETE